MPGELKYKYRQSIGYSLLIHSPLPIILTSCHMAFPLVFVWQLLTPQIEAKQVVLLWSELIGLMLNSFPRKIRLFMSTPEKESENRKLVPIRVA